MEVHFTFRHRYSSTLARTLIGLLSPYLFSSSYALYQKCTDMKLPINHPSFFFQRFSGQYLTAVSNGII